MKTMGDVYPRLLDLPGYEAIAAMPFGQAPPAMHPAVRDRVLADPPPDPPGLLTMAGNLAGSAIAHVADGGRKASPKVQAERRAICRACPLLVDGGCTACGCGTIKSLSLVGLALDLKRSWASSRCPLEPPRWGAV